METTDLFGQTGRVETDKGGKPRLVFGETPPPARHGSIQQRSGQTPTATTPAPAPAATPAPAGKAVAARTAADKRRAAAPPPTSATPAPEPRYQRACAQAALLTHMLRVAAVEVERLKVAAGGEAAPMPPAVPSVLLDRAARTALGQPGIKAQVAFLTMAAGPMAPAPTGSEQSDTRPVGAAPPGRASAGAAVPSSPDAQSAAVSQAPASVAPIPRGAGGVGAGTADDSTADPTNDRDRRPSPD